MSTSANNLLWKKSIFCSRKYFSRSFWQKLHVLDNPRSRSRNIQKTTRSSRIESDTGKSMRAKKKYRKARVGMIELRLLEFSINVLMGMRRPEHWVSHDRASWVGRYTTISAQLRSHTESVYIYMDSYICTQHDQSARYVFPSLNFCRPFSVSRARNFQRSPV